MKIKFKTLLRVIIVVIFVLVFYVFWKYSSFIDGGKFKGNGIVELREFLKSSGRWSVFLFVLIYALKPIVFIIPASLLSVLGGILYGPYLGTIYTLIGAFSSATLAFFIAKILGRDAVEKILKGRKKIESFDEGIEKNGFKIMLLMRLAFVFPYDALSYAAGLSKMSYIHFIAGTMLGVLPEMITYNLFGGNIKRPFNKETITAFIVVLLLAMTAILLKPKNEKKLNK